MTGDEVAVEAERDDWETLQGFIDHELFLTGECIDDNVLESIHRVEAAMNEVLRNSSDETSRGDGE